MLLYMKKTNGTYILFFYFLIVHKLDRSILYTDLSPLLPVFSWSNSSYKIELSILLILFCFSRAKSIITISKQYTKDQET